ncbi:MAG: hypothetical protein KDC34_14685 [Saprospiraceae bacterium]|nr:hypothetical protein [Saprospiraceae bacterium]
MTSQESSNQIQNIIVVGLAIGAILGMGGSMVKDPNMQTLLYEISSLGLVVATVLCFGKYYREQAELVAAGFLIFAMGETAMSVGTQEAFGAGMALYVPALLLISYPNKFPLLVRITGGLASIPFAIAAFKIMMGEDVPSTSLFPSIGYGLFTVTIIGWIWTILRKPK